MGWGFHEYFAGGGLVRAGLGDRWDCLFANDFDSKKAASYEANWGNGELLVEDIRNLRPEQACGEPRLAWASFPCQDLSQAGGGAGLGGDRSGTFWSFWKLIIGLQIEGRAPDIIALENVCGTITSHKGKDFTAICEALSEGGYRVGALVVDAKNFLPQSRPRLFVVGVHKTVAIPPGLIGGAPVDHLHTVALRRAVAELPNPVLSNWIWWALPKPAASTSSLTEFLNEDSADVRWNADEQTCNLIKMMSRASLKKLRSARRSSVPRVGTVFRRMRPGKMGKRVQRAEVRFDELAGCLRTARGGSSLQSLMFVNGNDFRSRLLSAREGARLMGLDETFVLPNSYYETFHLLGDGVAVPVVRFLAHELFEPVLLAGDAAALALSRQASEAEIANSPFEAAQ